MTHAAKDSLSWGALPSYKKPPVNEVVCGMRFQPLDKLRVPHIGLLWDKFRADYPIIEHAPPISSPKGELLIDKVTGLPLPRIWFINKTGDQLIQFQFDRFYFNWRHRGQDYPRYNHIRNNYDSVRNTITKFFSEFNLGEIEPIEFELTYINHIPKGQIWDTMNDLPRIFSDFKWKKTQKLFLPIPEKLAWNIEFALPEHNGHLIVNLKQAIRTVDKAPLLVFELKAQGIGEKESVREWFDLAHEWIVRGFTDLTTPEIQKIWEREE